MLFFHINFFAIIKNLPIFALYFFYEGGNIK